MAPLEEIKGRQASVMRQYANKMEIITNDLVHLITDQSRGRDAEIMAVIQWRNRQLFICLLVAGQHMGTEK